MSLEFGFSRFKDATEFGKKLSSNLQTTSVLEQRDNKHFIVIPESKLTKLAASTLVVSIAIAGLASGNQHLTDEKYQMVIDSIQRANPSLANLTEPEIGVYLSNLTSEQMSGVVNNTKGVYHEMLFVDAHNVAGLNTKAALHEELNNPGADITFTEDGEVIGEIQLKATDSSSYVNEHIEKHPEIEVLATEEVANSMVEVGSTGISNTEITNDVVNSFDELKSIADTTDVVSETVTATIVDESIGFGPISIIAGLLFGIF